MRQKRSTRILSVLAGLALLMSGCAKTIAPKKWLPKPSEIQNQAFGGWIKMEYASETGIKTSQGELIAIQDNSVYLLTEEGLLVVPSVNIHNAALSVYTNQKALVSTWAILGTLSAGSHGLLAFISAPIWLISGIASTSAESQSGFLRHPNRSWQEIAKFARFPQGIPKGLDLKTLEPKR